MPSAYYQRLDPLEGLVPWSSVWSTLLAGLPVLVLFWLLVPRRWLAPKAGAAGALTAIVIAIAVYRMPADMALWSFVDGVAFGILPVGWTIFSAMLLYNITVETGQFTIVRRSVAGLSGDARIQAVLVGFSFGAFLEGAAGGGTPVAICGAIMVGLGFKPFLAAVLCLIANTSPVAYGGLGTPILVLHGVTGLDAKAISTMAGHQLPILSFIIPIWMVKCMCSWKQTLEVWPALVVSGGSFALFQFTFATFHEYVPAVVLYPMTDIGGGIFSLVVTAIFLAFWRPRNEWHFNKPLTTAPVAAALLHENHAEESKPLTARNVALAWTPYVLMSMALMLTGLVRQKETPVKPGPGPVQMREGFSTNYQIPVPTLHDACYRDELLHEQGKERKPESALFNFAWLTSPGSAVFAAAVLSMLMMRMNGSQVARVFGRTFFQMRIPIPTIACMLGLSYVTRYAGMDATLGYAFAYTGLFYPFFAAILGWLGVFLTGTDAGSNALFGSLQKITATQIYQGYDSAFADLSLEQAQVLICTANSTGGVMGKMIDAQSICVATAATNQLGSEASIFKAVVWHSIVLASIVGLLTLLQAYFYPFTHMVPIPAQLP
ncbi:MAG: L-lactate permease [Planctomycetes bacterium]|nr:L-lactate permease [Planctomycetota bacterium]